MEFKWKDKSVRRLLVISFLLCAAAAVITFTGYREKDEARQWVTHTHEVIEDALLVQSIFEKAETNQRGFLLTADSNFYFSFHKSIARLSLQLDSILIRTNDNRIQHILIRDSIRPALIKRLEFMNETTALFRGEQNDNEKLRERLVTAQSQDEDIQRLLTQLIGEENALLYTRNARLDRTTRFTEWVMYSSLVLIAFTSVLAYLTIRRAQKANQSLLDSLDQANRNLERKVEEQTAHIQDANEELVRRNDDLSAINEELRSSEEEVRANLEYIISLKNELEKSEELHRMLSENSMDIIAVFSTENTFEYLSPAVKRILGYEPKELIGIDGSTLIHPEDRDILIQPQQLATEQMSLISPHFRLRRKDGSYVWIESHATPITDSAGRTIKMQTLNRDISDRKMAEIAMREAKEKAEEATLVKSQFLSTMSHEIRTPMNAVIGITTLLMEENPREDQLEKLKLLKFSGDNLLTIINDILDFSKIEAGKLTLEYISFNLREQLSNLHSLYKPKTTEKGIDLLLNFGNDVPGWVIGDPVRLSQIIGNLVSNAIKFTAKGYVEIDVQVQKTEGKLYYLSFNIKDTGIGIAADKQAHVFERFSQADSDTTRKFGGTGLGLAITRNLVALMQGEIKLTSMEGHGSTFQFLIAMTEGEAAMKHKDMSAKDVQAGVNACVLLVEDNVVNQVIARNFLSKWNLQVDIAQDGLQALERMESKLYDLVLMDLQMPEMDGYTAAQQIRKREDTYFKDVPIIALTASAMIEVKQKVMEFGMNDTITKPFDPDELRGKIFKHIRRVKKQAEEAPPVVINFHAFMGHENDEFKYSLAQFIKSDIRALQNVVMTLGGKEDAGLLSATLHQKATSLGILKDPELTALINELKHNLSINSTSDLQQKKEQIKLAIDRITTQLTQLQERLTDVVQSS